jgi:hypothetical protein
MAYERHSIDQSVGSFSDNIGSGSAAQLAPYDTFAILRPTCQPSLWRASPAPVCFRSKSPYGLAAHIAVVARAQPP